MAITSVIMQTPGTCLRLAVESWLEGLFSSEADKWPLNESVWRVGDLMNYLQDKYPSLVGPSGNWFTYDRPPSVQDPSTTTDSIQNWVNNYVVAQGATYAIL